MTLLVILVAISLQRFLHVPSIPYRLDWAGHYYDWCARKIEYMTRGHGLLGVAILIVPMLLLGSVVLSMVFHLFGFLGYTLVSLALFWYCTDARDLLKQPYVSLTPTDTLIHVSQSLFGPIFWFFLFGPMGLLFYYLVHYFKDYLVARQDAESRELELYSEQVTAILDWVPARLFSFCFALLGHFSLIFKKWFQLAFVGLDPKLTIIAECAEPVVSTQDEAVSLIDRTLAAWLIVIALITISSFFGHH